MICDLRQDSFSKDFKRKFNLLFRFFSFLVSLKEISEGFNVHVGRQTHSMSKNEIENSLLAELSYKKSW